MANRTGTFYTAETLAKFGINAELLVGDGASPESFEAVAGIRMIEPGEQNSADILLTHLRSPRRHAEHAPGRRDSAPFNFTGIWMPTEESQSNAGGGSGSFTGGGLVAINAAQETRNWIIRTYPPAEQSTSPDDSFDWPFRGYMASLKIGQIVDNNIVEISGSIQPRGDYTETLP